MVTEYQRVVLTVDLPEYGLQARDVGVVVHVYKDGAAYEVEFFTLDDATLDVVTVEAEQLRAINSRDVMHARAMPESA